MYITENMPFITESNGKPRYMFEEHYQKLLNADISLINDSLYTNREQLSGIKSPLIPPLNYKIDAISNGPINYTFLWVNDKTPTGKTPKYIYTVHFNTLVGDYFKEWMNDTFGEIHYLQNGNIGKVRIIMWRNKKLSIVHLKRHNNKLIISKVEIK